LWIQYQIDQKYTSKNKNPRVGETTNVFGTDYLQAWKRHEHTQLEFKIHKSLYNTMSVVLKGLTFIPRIAKKGM